jgi:hypothetical protein
MAIRVICSMHESGVFQPNRSVFMMEKWAAQPHGRIKPILDVGSS